MNSLTDASPRLPRSSWWGMLVLLALALGCALAVMLLWQRDGALGGLSLALALLAGAGFALLALALGWQMGVRLTRQRLGESLRESLREARQHSHVLAQLQSDWQWQTDAHHHLVRWQAPQAALASSWVGAAATQALWERFVLVDGGEASLRQRLNEQVALLDVQVEGALEQGAAAQFSGRWLLRAQPCLDAQGRFCGYLGTARPVREVASNHPHAPAQQWLPALPGPAWLLADSAEHGSRLLDLNEAAAQLQGRPIEQLRGQPWRACLDGLPHEIREAAAAPEAQQGLPCGAWWLCMSSLATPGSVDGQSLKLLSLWPQATLETVPAALAAEAAEVARADQESFSYTVSHDLRAPLRVVEGFTRILKEDYGRLLDRIGNDHLDRVLGASARMNSMIDALLSLTQLSAQPLARQPVNLSQLASYVIEDLRRAAPERVVDVSIQPHLVVHGDPVLLRMVLENLLGNAWKYSAKCAHARISFESVQRAGAAVFVVSDNGAGFDMRFADRLFGVFQRLHSASEFQGTGVGLASVRRIVHRHGGEIWAESEVGQGARFFFSLS
ncbi:ATP-binding protein [Paucibacter sp. APW11]|uniref:histidine kinase n=1 Tax=Roseateles aquae TaxID=3077235 RepID=A0ABU3P9V1_9BURK|nr:ATP-binding protein [Paucibacter sp. APW11]MDT8999320.1 ATP-binding protein [Paucibacter sp. APW11]